MIKQSLLNELDLKSNSNALHLTLNAAAASESGSGFQMVNTSMIAMARKNFMLMNMTRRIYMTLVSSYTLFFEKIAGKLSRDATQSSHYGDWQNSLMESHLGIAERQLSNIQSDTVGMVSRINELHKHRLNLVKMGDTVLRGLYMAANWSSIAGSLLMLAPTPITHFLGIMIMMASSIMSLAETWRGYQLEKELNQLMDDSLTSDNYMDFTDQAQNFFATNLPSSSSSYTSSAGVGVDSDVIPRSVVDYENHDTLYLYTDFDKSKFLNNEELVLEKDHFVSITYYEKINSFNIEDSLFEFEKTKVYWRNWCAKTPSFELYNDQIIRSAITLKLLTFEKTGAVLAAATTSLPETIGEERNWDYRFCWIRDASMVIKVFTKLGHQKIVKNFINYILNLIPDKNEKLQIMYGIDGNKNLAEKTLDYFKGYKNSSPVRIGNAAFIQKQNDIYGILMDAIHYQILKFDQDNDKNEELWSIVKSIVWVVENNWSLPDKGIWEFRNEDKHFTFSKVLCWVAIDRAIKVSEIIQNGISARKWRPLRDKIFDDIMKNAWNNKVGAFTQSYNSNYLDASVLLMETYGFISPKSPKYIKTVKVIEKELLVNGLMFRYKNDDDFGSPSSSFTVCSFWLIDSLFKIGEENKAKIMFDKLLNYGNHLQLFSEDIDFKSKRLLGNFPQAYSHLALINTAMKFNLKHNE